MEEYEFLSKMEKQTDLVDGFLQVIRGVTSIIQTLAEMAEDENFSLGLEIEEKQRR